MEQHQLKEEIGYLIKQAGRIASYHLDSKFEQAGFNITSEQWGIIRLLWKENGQTQQSLAFKLKKNKASITSLVDNLEKKGYVVRTSNELDKRSKIVFLTDEGKEIWSQLNDIVDTSIRKATDGVTDDELKICTEVIKRMIRNVM
ncbi:MAG TPA: hypothetical protein DDY13_14205 [Cytophagales bacterium]|jgi:DNA-binding MarR family transcriptional regulator|nr:hypothetical protein [Cytophagales bacterium]